jgi:kynurenine formamidase
MNQARAASPLPTYAELGGQDGVPAGASWSVFGREDELGTLNLVDAECVLRAKSLVRKGAVFSLNWKLEYPDPPLFGRKALVHGFIDGGHTGVDDYYDRFHPQASSQWDSLSHIPHPEFGFYNGRSLDEIRPGSGNKNGAHNAARRGIVGRFVLVDVERYRRANGGSVRYLESDGVSLEELVGALAYQEVELRRGDIVLVRFGWVEWYENEASATEKAQLAASIPVSPGLEPSRALVEWLWDSHIAAIASDNPGLEAGPVVFEVGKFMHYDLIPLLGLAVGELFELGALAEDCASDRVYEGMFVAAPLNKLGGIGSSANAIALK